MKNNVHDIDKQITQLMEEKKRLEQEERLSLERQKIEEEAAAERAVDDEIAEARKDACTEHIKEKAKKFVELEKNMASAAELFKTVPILESITDAKQWADMLYQLGNTLDNLYRAKTEHIGFLCKSYKLADNNPYDYMKLKKNPTPAFLRNERKLGHIPCIPFSEDEEQAFNNGRDVFAERASHFKEGFDVMIANFITINNILCETNSALYNLHINVSMNTVSFRDSEDADSDFDSL